MSSKPTKALLSALLILLCAGAAHSQTVRIMQIDNPELVEVRRLRDGEYLSASELDGLKPPVRATRISKDQLRFRHHGEDYEIARGDVTLKGEQALVVDACSTVAVSMPSDSKQASVKGAGEGCK